MTTATEPTTNQEKYRKGQATLHLWIPTEVKKALEVFADERTQRIREVVIEAIRRHLAYPPPKPEKAALPPVVPLPDVAKRPRGRPKKKVGNNS